MHDSVTVHIAAPPEPIWELVSDVTQIGRYSPETFEAEWLDGATGPAVGARFRGHVKRNGRGPTYWTTCTVIACEPGREFAFGVAASRQAAERVALQARTAGDGTDVTESFELQPTAAAARSTGRCSAGPGAGRTATACETTLERIKAEVESR